MKLTAKHIMFVLMSLLLVLVIIMGIILLNRVSAFLQIGGGPNTNVPAGTNPSSGTASSTPASSVTSQPNTSDTHVHEFVKGKTYKPTCISSGYTLYECACGKEDIRDFTDPYGHNYSEPTVIPDTCEVNGWTERVCSRCDYIEKTNFVTASHDFGEWENIEEAEGEQEREHRICTTCQMEEIKRLDPSATTIIRRYVLENAGGYAHYKVIVDVLNLESDPTHEVYVDLVHGPVDWEYRSTGLNVLYKVDGIPMNCALSYSKTLATIHADGSVTYAAPEITPDTDTNPDTDTTPDADTTPDVNPDEEQPE